MALLHSTSLYMTLPRLYFTLHYCTMAKLHSTSLYITLPWIYLTLHDSTILYHGYYFTVLHLHYHGSTSLYLTLRCSELPWLYLTLLGSTLPYHGSTSLHLTLHYSTMTLLYSILHSTWLSSVAVEKQSCPTWYQETKYNRVAKCVCGATLDDNIMCNYTTQETLIFAGYCMNYNDTTKITVAGGCPFSNHHDGASIFYAALPNNNSELNTFMCSGLNLTGLLCSQCQRGLGPLFSPTNGSV